MIGSWRSADPEEGIINSIGWVRSGVPAPVVRWLADWASGWEDVLTGCGCVRDHDHVLTGCGCDSWWAGGRPWLHTKTELLLARTGLSHVEKEIWHVDNEQYSLSSLSNDHKYVMSEMVRINLTICIWLIETKFCLVHRKGFFECWIGCNNRLRVWISLILSVGIRQGSPLIPEVPQVTSQTTHTFTRAGEKGIKASMRFLNAEMRDTKWRMEGEKGIEEFGLAKS